MKRETCFTEAFYEAAQVLNKIPVSLSIADRVRLGMDILKLALADMQGNLARREVLELVCDDLTSATDGMADINRSFGVTSARNEVGGKPH